MYLYVCALVKNNYWKNKIFDTFDFRLTLNIHKKNITIVLLAHTQRGLKTHKNKQRIYDNFSIINKIKI